MATSQMFYWSPDRFHLLYLHCLREWFISLYHTGLVWDTLSFWKYCCILTRFSCISTSLISFASAFVPKLCVQMRSDKEPVAVWISPFSHYIQVPHKISAFSVSWATLATRSDLKWRPSMAVVYFRLTPQGQKTPQICGFYFKVYLTGFFCKTKHCLVPRFPYNHTLEILCMQPECSGLAFYRPFPL